MKFKDYVKKYEKLQEFLGGKDLCERFYSFSFTYPTVQGSAHKNADIIENYKPTKNDDDGGFYYIIEGVQIVLVKE